MFEPTSHDSVTLRRIRQVMASGQHPGYDPQLAMKTPEGEYSFLRFESRWMDDFLAILQKLDFPASEVRATGGGAFKVRNLLPAARVADECALLPAARLPLMPVLSNLQGCPWCTSACSG